MIDMRALCASVKQVAEQLKHQPLWLYKVPKKFFVVSCRSELMLPDLKLPFRRNQIWKQQIEHKDVGIRLMPNQENNQKFTGLLHGLARKRAQFQQQSFRCFAFQHQRELCNRHAIITSNSVYALKLEKSGMVYKCVACSLKNKIRSITTGTSSRVKVVKQHLNILVLYMQWQAEPELTLISAMFNRSSRKFPFLTIVANQPPHFSPTV
ncbi:hypothetical protein ACFX2J_041657 [Malus domestica]